MAYDAGLIDFHTHSLLSDGLLLPSELVRRYDAAGFKAIAITDHTDSSNIDMILEGLVRVSQELNKYWKIITIPGVELTHLPVEQFSSLVRYARSKGAKIVIGHGESPVEPVIKGTNRAAIEAGVDILAHPGDILKDDAALAADKGVLLEITTRRGHKGGNLHVADTARAVSAGLIMNSDCHSPADIPSESIFDAAAKKAGLGKDETARARSNAEKLLQKIINLT